MMKLWQVEITGPADIVSRGKVFVGQYVALAETAEAAIRDVCANHTVAADDVIVAFPVDGTTVSMGSRRRFAKEISVFRPAEGMVTGTGADFGVEP